jgi:carbonic anhydrase
MSVIDELIEANARYASGKPPGGDLQPPSRQLAVVTCMDARFFPSQVLGLGEGEAHVIRNAGGRTPEALRSLVLSQRLLGTNAIAVVQHTECGMLTFKNEDIYAKVKEDLGEDASDIDFMPFPDLEQNVREDVEFLKKHPLIGDDSEIRGFVYDVKTRRLTEVT